MTHRFWTTRELALVSEHYPQGGIAACLAHVNRSRASIWQKARAMGLSAPGYVGVRESWPNDPELDARLVRLHQRPLTRGAITGFAAQVGRPCWYISRRARELGLKTPRFREAPWCADEIELLHETAHIGTANARLRFLRAGFRRSETAIHVKRKREAIGIRQAKQDAGVYTTCQVADLLGVDRSTPMRWIRAGELIAARRGDMAEISERELRAFVVAHPLRIELRKIPDSSRVWFIQLLAGDAGAMGKRPCAPVELAA